MSTTILTKEQLISKQQTLQEKSQSAKLLVAASQEMHKSLNAEQTAFKNAYAEMAQAAKAAPAGADKAIAEELKQSAKNRYLDSLDATQRETQLASWTAWTEVRSLSSELRRLRAAASRQAKSAKAKAKSDRVKASRQAKLAKAKAKSDRVKASRQAKLARAKAKAGKIKA